MLIHNVYFWLKPNTSEADRKGFEQGMKTFLDAVPQIKQYQIGAPAATPKRDVVDQSFDYSMFVYLETLEDQDIYQAHPAHDVFIANFKDLWDKVQVRDSELV